MPWRRLFKDTEMAKEAASLQNYNQELVKYIEHLRTQKEKLEVAVAKEEQDKAAILDQIEILNQRLNEVSGSIQQKLQMLNNCKKTLLEAENGLNKIIESSQVLLTLVQQESEMLKF